MAITKSSPQKGETYKLSTGESYGVGIGAMPPGTQVMVDYVYTEPVAGLGGDEGVLASWATHGGEVRSVQFSMAEFLVLFKKGK